MTRFWLVVTAVIARSAFVRRCRNTHFIADWCSLDAPTIRYDIFENPTDADENAYSSRVSPSLRTICHRGDGRHY
jgi:hypothetical protein